ncbi:MAG: sigma-54-dependent Fis family transcriptional regulator [Deltaproteobacteria bacterium]|nr:MAG: sigma-54-dependent Fis family transcriptional regulator [Deltaproteobacteria bacterium]
MIADCALLSAGLLESELFGYEKGAFTGAYTRKIGHFEVANGGTLFLDEIGDLPLEVQGKLLRAVQERVIFRVGGVDPIKVDTRIIAATNQDLEEKVRRKQFREDLYYRLNVVIIKVPPLRERKEDIPLLTTYFLNKYAARFQKKVEIKQEVYDAFCQYPWPGNVRELENLIQNLLIVSGGNAIRLKDLPTKILAQLRPSPAETVQSSYKELKRKVVADFTRDFLIAMLRKNRGNVSKTAREIRLRRTSLQRLMKRFGLRASDFRNLPL